MKKLSILVPKEDWICDRLGDEWMSNRHSGIESKLLKNIQLETNDILWYLADWCWKSVKPKSKVVTTVHHLVPWKWRKDKVQQEEFKWRDKITTVYHTTSFHTKKIIEKFTDKEIFVYPLWVDNKSFYIIDDKESIKNKYKISKDKFLIGSFQRDTEGSDLKTPKYEKGIDIFFEYVKKLNDKRKDVEVILGGWRRQYIKSKLDEVGIKHYDFDNKPSINVINELYNICDLCVCSSRVEGGPMLIQEASLLKIPIISTDVGSANQILHEESIGINPCKEDSDELDLSKKGIDAIVDSLLSCKPNVEYAYNSVIKNNVITNGFHFYENLIRNI